MADVMTPEQRSGNMQAIKSKGSKIELLVRRYLYSKGIRYRLHKKGLPGTPDLVFNKYKIVVFVNGCYWHQHENCRLCTQPKSRSAFWNEKLGNNKERDIRNIKKLRDLGWKVLVVWECDLEEKPKFTLQKLYNELVEKK
jgi:DNA mismatch endonuclease (patch repair protein)